MAQLITLQQKRINITQGMGENPYKISNKHDATSQMLRTVSRKEIYCHIK